MQKLFFIFLVFLIFGCRRSDTLTVYFENNSDINHQAFLETFLEDSLIDRRCVVKGDTALYQEKLSIALPANRDTITLNFRAHEIGYSTRCVLSRKQITNRTWMHVALKETVFRKGDNFYGRILNNDTIVAQEIYCELADQPRSITVQ